MTLGPSDALRALNVENPHGSSLVADGRTPQSPGGVSVVSPGWVRVQRFASASSWTRGRDRWHARCIDR